MQANVKLQDMFGNTPLHYACSKGNVEIASLLIESQAPLVKYNLKGMLPFHAGINSELHMVKYLMGRYT